MCESTGHQMLILFQVQGFFSKFLWIIYIFKLCVQSILTRIAKPSLLCPGCAEIHLKSVCDKMSYERNFLPGTHLTLSNTFSSQKSPVTWSDWINTKIPGQPVVCEESLQNGTHQETGHFFHWFQKEFSKADCQRRQLVLCWRTAGSVVFQFPEGWTENEEPLQ